MPANSLNPPGVDFPPDPELHELYEEDNVVYMWTSDRWIVWNGSAGVSQAYVDDQIANLQHDIQRDYVTTSDANKTYLKDGNTTSKLMINRTAGGSIDSMKVTAITGGATVWRFDCKAGKDGPVIYKTEGSASHRFIGKVDVERLGQEKQGFCIKGRKSNGEEGELFWAYHNSGNAPDAINYTGKMDSANNIVTKGYIDSLLTSRIAALEERIRKLEGKE